MKKQFCFVLILCFLSSSLILPVWSSSTYSVEQSESISGFQDSFTVFPGEEYVLKYSPDTFAISKYTNQLSELLTVETIKQAIVKAPDWLEFSLLHQFEQMENPSSYADLILNASKQYTDEIAFCIAHAPLGNVPDPSLILDNVKQVYNVDELISYADVIDLNQSMPDCYSTIQYQVLSNNETVQRILPKEIYYWDIVHPKIMRDTPSYVYDEFWRDYVFYHNDKGYPLLLEKIENISFLWDEQSYHQPGNRIWSESINLHPTSVEAVSYWIGKTVPFPAAGNRPLQPNHIAHQHNGWCGELQKIAVAALRSVLVPSISVCNIAEDHVWREFYDNGWHQNDNWWSDTGGTVDVAEVYDEGWGKDMSSVFSWRGDGVISDVTSRYINSNDTVNVSFSVSNMVGTPVDGARVTVLVKGLKDISWHKNQVLIMLETIWHKIPAFLQNSLLSTVYDRIVHRIENVSDVIDGLTVSIWNYTNAEGLCSFTLGKNDEYVFLIQQPIDSLPFPLGSPSTLRWLKYPEDSSFSIRFPRSNHEKKPLEVNGCLKDSLSTVVNLSSSGVQYQANIKTNDIGQISCSCPISFFVLTEKEYNKYVNDEAFNAKYYLKDDNINDILSLDDDPCYFVFYNPSQNTIAMINLDLDVTQSTSQDFISIIQPSTTVFSHPHFQIGETIKISGVASDQTTLQINNQTISQPDGAWTFLINTTGWNPGSYTLKATCNMKTSEKQITLFDSIPPTTSIVSPRTNSIFSQGENIIVNGLSLDNHKIKTVMLGIDDSNWIMIQDPENWSKTINTENNIPGLHQLSIKTIDENNNQQIIHQPFVINDTSQSHEPVIHSIERSFLQQQSEETTVVIYANITSDDMFPIKQAYVEYKTEGNEIIKENKLYPYAQHPVQSRHPEDPKKNQSNTPIYGCELGRFKTNETVSVRVTAIDIANNKQVSTWKTIQLQ